MKIKISKNTWEEAGKRAGWMKQSQIIPDDGVADGGTPYTDEEMELIEKERINYDPITKQKVDKIKEEVGSLVHEWNNGEGPLSKETLELQLKELIDKMYLAMGKKPDPNAP